MDPTSTTRWLFNTSPLLLTAATTGLIYCIYLVVYRLYLCPIAKVPGPKLAALSFWYEFYYDVVKQGQYTFKIEEFHKKYGPVVRINPYEVHINDPEYYEQIYVGSSVRPTDKWWWSTEMFAVPSATISTVPHALHRRRRAMLSHHFSTTAILRIEHVIQTKIEKLMNRLEQARGTGQPIAINNAYSALTRDIITVYCFAKSDNRLDQPDFDCEYDTVVGRVSLASHFCKQFPWVIKSVAALPPWLVRRMIADQGLLLDLQANFRRQVVRAVRWKAESEKTGNKIVDEDVEHLETTVIGSMIDADVPSTEKSINRLAQEAQMLLIAGSLTTAHTLTTITYYLLCNESLIDRLRKEVQNAKAQSDVDGNLPLKTLESLPYLTAVIREGLRISYGAVHRLQRVSPTTTLQYGEFIFPPGTPLSMSGKLMHDNEKIFPEPHQFLPDRWLPLETNGAHLNKYLVPFSKGSRACLGMNLAWAEMYMVLAEIFGTSQLTFELYDFNFERDLKTVMDAFGPLASFESKGVRVLVS